MITSSKKIVLRFMMMGVFIISIGLASRRFKKIINKTYMDAPVKSTQYLPLRADFQHKLRF